METPQQSAAQSAAKVAEQLRVHARGIDWAVVWACVQYFMWIGLTKSIVTIVYLALISQGLRYVLPDIGLRLWKLPALAFLKNYTATYRLDLAHLFALIPLISAWILWDLNLELYLLPQKFAERFRSWDADRIKRIVVTMGIIIIGGDALLFCAAFTLSQWGNAKLSPAAIIATTVYVTVLGFVCFIGVFLKQRISQLRSRKDQA